jgi:hypothetical protein
MRLPFLQHYGGKMSNWVWVMPIVAGVAMVGLVAVIVHQNRLKWRSQKNQIDHLLVLRDLILAAGFQADDGIVRRGQRTIVIRHQGQEVGKIGIADKGEPYWRDSSNRVWPAENEGDLIRLSYLAEAEKHIVHEKSWFESLFR